MTSIARRILIVGLLFPWVALASPGPSELAAAREAYREGIGLETAGNWAAALSRFREVAAVKSNSRVRFHIGLCQENLGRWTEALGAYNMALLDAGQENAADVIKEVEAARTALDAKTPRLTIRRAPGSEGATISVDGVVLGASVAGSAMPFDPGTHVIESSQPGRAAWRAVIELKAGDRKELEAMPPGAPAPALVSPSPPAQAAPRSKSPLPWIVMGAGAASLGAAGVFYVLRRGAISDLEEACGSEFRCSEAQRPRYDDARTYNLLTNVTLGLGVVGLGAGTVLLLKRNGDRQNQQGTASRPGVGVLVLPTGAGLAGQF